MKKVQVDVRYKDKSYHSQINEMSEKDLSILKDFIYLNHRDGLTNLTLENNGSFIYLPKNILKKSVITITIIG